jgi:hypothetical protein
VLEAAHGDAVTAAGFDVHVYGHDHAEILSGIPVIANTDCAVGGVLFHPGDSFIVPKDPGAKLLLPVSAPWLRFADAAAHARECGRGRWLCDPRRRPE